MARIEAIYISASINRQPQAADISSKSLVCFTSQKLLALWDASGDNEYGVLCTLPGHQAEVNCVKFLEDENFIASGDQQGVLQVRMKRSGKWDVVKEQIAHSKPISSLATYRSLIVTGSSDATVKVWKFTAIGKIKDGLELVQTLDMKGRYPLDVQLTAFPDTSCLILAIASTGREVNIWTGTEIQFVHSTSLSGHEDWIRSLAFTQSRRSPPQLTLASGSQDSTIRLWTIDPIVPQRPQTSGDDILDAFESSLDEFFDGEEGGRQMSNKRHIIAIKSPDGSLHHFALVFDALLIGHEAGITSLSWKSGVLDAPTSLSLLSTSVDSSIILWSPILSPGTSDSVEKQTTSLWVNQQRFGDVGGQRLGGFVGGFWANTGREVLGWGWGGGWRRWRLRSAQGGPENWEEIGAITGHQGVVKSIAWTSHGEYLLSTGLDQTTRIHGPRHRQSVTSSQKEVWHELARPQVHGYDVVGAEFLTPLRFVSISDEKVARVFDAPKHFAATVNSLGVPVNMESRPSGANVPPLGLSNKATVEDEVQGSNLEVSSFVHRYPFESELASITLWPEIEKIFGHGYELIAVAASHSGSIIATACKSTTPEHAVLRVYNTQNWQLMGNPLVGHALTVTRIAFSSDDSMILSVSRDRTWRLFRLNAQGDSYIPLAMDKPHGRIIWDCAWMIDNLELGFATASRDKTVKIWRPVNESNIQWTAVTTLKFREAVTAVDFSSVLSDGRRRLAIGLESGEIMIFSSEAAEDKWTLEMGVDPQLSHVESIQRIVWRPSKDKGNIQQLATCSEDRTIRVMMVHLDFH